MRIRRVGRNALLIEFDGDATDAEQQVQAWRGELWRRREAGALAACEIVPGARTILIDGIEDVHAGAAMIDGWPAPTPTDVIQGPLVEIETTYDGEDLGDVADLWGVTVDELIHRLSSTELRVAFGGFAPGFAYLTGLPAEVPRLASPRARVPAGSVALAGPYAGIYPSPSPGGWRLVGRTDAVLFDVEREPPALLTPGTRVRLVQRDRPGD